MSTEEPLWFLVGGKEHEVAEDDFDFYFYLEELKNYLGQIEELLSTKAATLRERNPFYAGDPLEEALEHLFPNILRKSLFLAVYTLAEAELVHVCRSLKEQKNLLLSLSDIYARGGNIIEKVKKYLQGLAGISFPDTSEWREMDDYRKLRNCIVHRQGSLTSKGADKYLRDTYIPHQPYLSTQDGLYGDEVFFHKGFCEKVVETVSTCFQQLYAALP